MLVLLSALSLIGMGVFALLAPFAFFYGLFSQKLRDKQTAYLREQAHQPPPLLTPPQTALQKSNW